MTGILHVLPREQVVELVGHAREDHARYVEASTVHRPFRGRHIREAAARAAADILVLAAELANEADEVASLHRHMAVAIREECRQKRRADAAEADAVWLAAENVRLRAELDQVRATLRDREVSS